MPLAQMQQPFQEIKAEPARPRGQFADVQSLLAEEQRLPVAPKSEHDFRVGIGNDRGAGYVMRHLAQPPRLRASFGEIVALDVPQQRLAEGLALFQQV